MTESKPHIVLIGGGGHCMAVIDVIEQQGQYDILGVLDADDSKADVLGYKILGGDDQIESLAAKGHHFIITVGQIKSYSAREDIAKKLADAKANIATLISPNAYVSPHAQIKRGTVVMHGATVGPASKVGQHCILNTQSNIEHGAAVGDFCHISTGAMVNGDCMVGRGSFVGSNATLSHGVSLPENSIISAGKFIKS